MWTVPVQFSFGLCRSWELLGLQCFDIVRWVTRIAFGPWRSSPQWISRRTSGGSKLWGELSNPEPRWTGKQTWEWWRGCTKLLDHRTVCCVCVFWWNGQQFMQDCSDVMQLLLKTQTEMQDMPEDDPQVCCQLCFLSAASVVITYAIHWSCYRTAEQWLTIFVGFISSECHPISVWS